MKRALVCGAGGFIGSHLVNKLKSVGYWVRGVDLNEPRYVPAQADDFQLLDLRKEQDCEQAVSHPEKIDEVYQLAANVGGIGYLYSAETEIMRNNALINLNMVYAAARNNIKRYFFSSSVCVYRDMTVLEPAMSEEGVYPAMPDCEYGWEKLYAERVLQAFEKRYGMSVRIARLQTCYGPAGNWCGGKENAPAAICRKVAEVEDGGEIEVWGDGSAIRSYTYVEDITEGIYLLMQSGINEPVNIGSPEYVNVKELIQTVAELAGKRIGVNYVNGPVGVQARNFSTERIYSLGWRPKFSLFEGLRVTYPWIEQQVKQSKELKRAVNF